MTGVEQAAAVLAAGPGVQGCHRASGVAAGSCQHLSLQTLPWVWSRCLQVAGNKEGGRCACFSSCATREAVDLQPDRLYWVNQNTLQCSHQGFQKDGTAGSPALAQLGGSCPEQRNTRCSCSIHAMAQLRTEAAASSGLFPWIIPRLIPRHC